MSRGGRRLDDREALLNAYSFTMGASTTTPHVAAHALLALIEQPEAWRTLKARPGLARLATLEALRWASPTNHLMRRTLTPVEIAGTKLEAGELVCAWVASGNRDETVFASPDRFDPARTPNPHLAFGVGVHRCVGAAPAQLALMLLLEEMVARLDGFELAGEPTHLYSNFINGITHLPVRFHPG